MLVINEDKKKKNRIMIVDDDPDICVALREVFKDNGFTADSFTDPHFAGVSNILNKAKFMIDLTVLHNDGGGIQYTQL